MAFPLFSMPKQMNQKKSFYNIILFYHKIILFCLPFLGFSQKAWLRADLGVTTTPTNGVSEWVFQNFNSNNHAGTQTNTNAQPLYVDDGINYNPSILFDGNDDYLPLNVREFSRNIDNFFVFAVIKTDFDNFSNNQNNNWAILDFDRSEFFSFAVSDGIYLSATAGGNTNDIYGNQVVNNGVPYIVSASYDNTLVNDVNLYVDGALDHSSDTFGTGTLLGKNSPDRFGYVGDGSEAASFNSDGNDIFYDGEIAEIIYYKNNLQTTLTTSKIDEINTYLAIKYGITLAQPNSYLLTGNVLAWDKDQAYGGRYNHNIAGIFRDDAYTLDQRISKSINPDAILTIALDNDFTVPNLDRVTRSSAFATDVTGLVWGHNGFSKNRYQTAIVNNNAITYKKRIWYAVDTNFNSNVHLRFSDESIVDGATYYLLTESDGDEDFSNDGVLNPTGVVASNNSVVFTNVNVSNTYFTIADKIPNNYMRHGKFFRDGVEQEIKK